MTKIERVHAGDESGEGVAVYLVGDAPPPLLRWGPSNPPPIGTGARRGNLESLSKRKRAATPPEFADLLIHLAACSRLAF